MTCQNQGDLSSDSVKCCYLLGTKKDGTEFNNCIAIVDNKVNDYKTDYLSNNEDVSDVSIECGNGDSDKASYSSFIKVSSLSLLLFFF